MLTEKHTQRILQLVKKEPCTIQDLSHAIGKSWVTTETYVNHIAKDTGLIQVKSFRKGTKGALKIVYWNYAESLQSDEIRQKLFETIKLFKSKSEFDPIDLFQFVPEKQGRAFIEPYPSPKTQQRLVDFFEKIEHELLSFSGNISWMRHAVIIAALDRLLQRGVQIKIVARMDVATLQNLKKIEHLIKKYPGQVEIRHASQPIRGMIADQKIARLKDEKNKSQFKDTELTNDVRVFYEIYDPEWVNWLYHTFWYLFRTSIPYEQRMRVLERVNLA